MELGMSGQAVSGKKIWLGIGGIIIVIAIALMFLPFSFGSSTINAYFTPNSVRAGETLTLVVEVTNTLDENANSLTVNLANGSYDKSVLSFDKEFDTLTFVATGDVRKFYFTGTVLSDEHPGLYHLDVIVELDGQVETVRPALEVMQ